MNVTHFYLDAIVFENTNLIHACETIIQAHIDRILADEAESAFLYNLPGARMVSLFKASGLNCKDEMHLMEFFEKYLKHRESLPPLKEESEIAHIDLKKYISPEEAKR